jgi:hypothetical protein
MRSMMAGQVAIPPAVTVSNSLEDGEVVGCDYLRLGLMFMLTCLT